MSSTCTHNMVNFGPLAAEIGLPVWGTVAKQSACIALYYRDTWNIVECKLIFRLGAPQLISTGFASWQRYCTAVN